MRQWFKVSSGICDDPDFEYLQTIDPSFGLVWLWLLCDCARRDSNEVRQLQERQSNQVCKRLGIDPKSYQLAMNALKEIGWIQDRKVRSWNRWQSPMDRTNAERQSRYRDRQRDRKRDREIEVTSRNALLPLRNASQALLRTNDSENQYELNAKITQLKGLYVTSDGRWEPNVTEEQKAEFRSLVAQRDNQSSSL